MSGTMGPDVIDVRKLYAETGNFTFDPLLHVDRFVQIAHHLYRRRRRHSGHRGYNIKKILASKSTYMEVATCF